MIRNSRNSKFRWVAIVSLLVVFSACQNKFENLEKYQRPEWLEGKVYTQLKSQEQLSDFASMVAEVGYDSVIDKSGTYTIFAPNNEAVAEFIAGTPDYGSVSDIPYDEKLKIVKYHILQMPWSKAQLQNLNISGWVNKDDESANKPEAYKRQTLLKNENKVYPVKVEKEGALIYESIVPEELADEERVVYSNSRKYAPIFFDEYMSIAEITGSDFDFYFDRTYEPGNVYYGGAKTIGAELFAENGFVYEVDRMVLPADNVEEIMEKGIDNHSYEKFLELIHLNSTFTRNDDATKEQEGAKEGLEVDQLYDLEYPDLAFDIQQESFNPDHDIESMQYHYGMIAPTDKAYDDFIANVLTGPGKWSKLDDVPALVTKLLINNYMALEPIYQHNIEEGFYNALGDKLMIDQSSIIQKSYGSNASFIGVDKFIVPKAFESVSAPLFLNPSYETNLMAMGWSRLLSYLKTDETNFSLFLASDQTLATDLSMFVTWQGWKKDRFTISSFDMETEGNARRTRADIENMMMNHIGVEPIVGTATKEFIKTLAGTFIVVDNTNNTITGGISSTFGYKGDSVITTTFRPLQGDYYNGKVYNVSGWLNFPGSTLYSYLSGTKFFELLQKAGLSDNYNVYALRDDKIYTLFLPSDEALDEAGADNMPVEELKKLLLRHFIPDHFIFTDGKVPSGKYRTMNYIKEGTNEGYEEIELQNNIDEIKIMDKQGNEFLVIDVNDNSSNQFAMRVMSQSGESTYYTTHVVFHRINKVLMLD